MTAVNVFISYSHIDVEYKTDFLKYIKPIVDNHENVKVWHDKDILTGQNLDEHIKNNLLKSSIVVCLISTDYLSSDYCINKELKVALSNDEIDKVNIFPIILRKCAWKHTIFADIKCQPTDARPIISWGDDKDDVYTDIADAFADVLKYCITSLNDKLPKKKT